MTETETEQPAEPAETPQEPAQEPTEPETAPEPMEEPAEPQSPTQEPEQAPTEPEQPAEPASPSGLSQTEAEKIIKDAGSDWQRFRQRTVDRWQGEGEHLRDCPMCFDSHKGLVDLRDAGQYPRELVNSIMAFLGLAREHDYKQSAKHNPCSFCDSYGKVATGSQVPEFATTTCPECKGYGYMPPPGGAGLEQGNGAGDHAAIPAPVTDIEQGEIDNWGEPKILPDGRPNPNFGKQPSFKVLVEPYGITANLSAPALADA